VHHPARKGGNPDPQFQPPYLGRSPPAPSGVVVKAPAAAVGRG
jgi:hypothetical protein